MGNSASTSEGVSDQGYSQLERKLQADLTYLKRAFTHLSASKDANQQSIPLSTLERAFNLAPLNVADSAPSTLLSFISEIGPALTRTFFNNNSGQVDWPLFLSGFDMCCKQGLGAVKLKSLFLVFVKGKYKHELLPGLQGEVDEDLTGFVTMSQLQDVFLICWLLMCHSRLENVQDSEELYVPLPNLRPLLASCYAAITGAPADTAWTGKEEIKVEKLTSWILATIPSITESIEQYVKCHIQRLGSEKKNIKSEDKPAVQAMEAADKMENVPKDLEKAKAVDPGLLTFGTAWAIGLFLRDSSGSNLVAAACDLLGSSTSYPTLLYRVSTHGRGISRFWTRVEGYKAPLLMLISGTSIDYDKNEPSGAKWVVGVLVPGGFENKEVFYGNSGCCLFAISPFFLPLRSTGKETNHVYCHKRTPGAVYRSHPRPEGVGFGGSPGKERLWLDDEFLTVTIQHHALDKSYHSGSLVPGQGYSPVKARVGEVEVWGLGGASANEQHDKYQHRETLFSEQRRKVDLKNFGNWRDSPEATMMEMISNPTKLEREER
ncbi:uncharacterized protein [Physcomitrium patens]|nr:uncharacterized protein LOC112282340 isoform X2 [Physcomitrium patens]XP_024375577.1 uncharacterized protein LOC112282340 isoform X2 [Physcomitrium patens]XP_024375578.1 uncharacterized protein LOC112282340 isoform X2 [Physcomitrium patens]PNR53859.1 hypothetical protein PHYPA_007534 [Physcomitrium patens]|eukprot:XP_024375576.1 uncharacterized protein LOC112282340 isoform X2 [Physcomitrella patens]